MSDLIIIFAVPFVGAALGGIVGVWLAWVRIRNEVLARMAAGYGGQPGNRGRTGL